MIQLSDLLILCCMMRGKNVPHVWLNRQREGGPGCIVKVSSAAANDEEG